jgi:hypothetical protein
LDGVVAIFASITASGTSAGIKAAAIWPQLPTAVLSYCWRLVVALLKRVLQCSSGVGGKPQNTCYWLLTANNMSTSSHVFACFVQGPPTNRSNLLGRQAEPGGATGPQTHHRGRQSESRPPK